MRAPRQLSSGLLVLVAACAAKPDAVVRVNSPTPGVFITVETYHGHGAIDDDYTWIYAHLEAQGKSDRRLVLAGEYLEGSTVMWASDREVTVCIPDGYTDRYNNYVTLEAGKAWLTIHSHLREDCNTRKADAPAETPSLAPPPKRPRRPR